MKGMSSVARSATVYLLVGALPAIGFGQKAEGPSGVPPYFSELPWMEESAHAAMQKVLQVGGGMPAAVAGYLASIRPDLDKMVEVASGPELVEVQGTPSFREARFAAETLIARGVSSYTAGDEEGAWKDWRAAWRMGRAVRRGSDGTPVLIQVMVGNAIEGLVINALERIWKENRDCKWLGGQVSSELALRAKEGVPAFDDVLENEWKAAVKAFRDASQDEAAADKYWKDLELPKKIGARKRSRTMAHIARRLQGDRKTFIALSFGEESIPKKHLTGSVDEDDLAEKAYLRALSASTPNATAARKRLKDREDDIERLKRLTD